MPKRWIIEGREGVEPRYWHAEMPLYAYSEGQMEQLLKTLVAKCELSFDEIIFAMSSKRSGFRSPLLEVARQHDPFVLTCGSNWNFTARIENI